VHLRAHLNAVTDGSKAIAAAARTINHPRSLDETLQSIADVSVPRVRHDQRWPRYVPRAVALVVKAQLAVRLYLDDEGAIGG
jgi:hypothetical protein